MEQSIVPTRRGVRPPNRAVLVTLGVALTRKSRCHLTHVGGFSLLRLYFSIIIRLTRPDGLHLDILTGAYILVRSLERFPLHRVNISTIVDEPVTAGGGLNTSPLPVGKAIRVQVQLNSGNRSPIPPNIFSKGTSKNASQTRFEPIECSITVGP